MHGPARFPPKRYAIDSMLALRKPQGAPYMTAHNSRHLVRTCRPNPAAHTLLPLTDYIRLLKYGDSLYRCKELKRAALVGTRWISCGLQSVRCTHEFALPGPLAVAVTLILWLCGIELNLFFTLCFAPGSHVHADEAARPLAVLPRAGATRGRTSLHPGL